MLGLIIPFSLMKRRWKSSSTYDLKESSSIVFQLFDLKLVIIFLMSFRFHPRLFKYMSHLNGYVTVDTYRQVSIH